MAVDFQLYPDSSAERDRWILNQRPPHNVGNVLDPRRPYAFHVESERAASGELAAVATIFLTNRECPWRCVMCDLWRNTLLESVPVGAIPQQIDFALSRLPAARQIKLYNSGSFFDLRAIPHADYKSIAEQLVTFEKVIVESHSALVKERSLRFRDLLEGQLEVAMGLETVHPVALEHLNKRMTTAQFAKAAEYLRKHAIDLRVFVLVQPPFIRSGEALKWAQRSLDFAFDSGATVVTLIPTRAGNGAMDRLLKSGDFIPPNLRVVEDALEYGIGLKQGRVFVDLWDIERVAACPQCQPRRIARLAALNASQRLCEKVQCGACGGGS